MALSRDRQLSLVSTRIFQGYRIRQQVVRRRSGRRGRGLAEKRMRSHWTGSWYYLLYHHHVSSSYRWCSFLFCFSSAFSPPPPLSHFVTRSYAIPLVPHSFLPCRPLSSSSKSSSAVSYFPSRPPPLSLQSLKTALVSPSSLLKHYFHPPPLLFMKLPIINFSVLFGIFL